MATIAVLGTLDTKGPEHAFVAGLVAARGHRALLIDVGTGAPPSVPPDITREEVAAAAGLDLARALAPRDRGAAVTAMSQAAPVLLARLAAEGRIQGVICLGGGGGTAIGSAAMRALPVGFPKLMVSTLASGNVAPYVGTKDIVMMPSLADVAGLNRLSRVIFTRAAGAICGMVEAEPRAEGSRPLVVASQFGNTTACVTKAKEVLEAAGYEVLVFAATGAGGRIMESVIESGVVAGVLDVTTTEWADELVGGALTAGPTRMDAAAKARVPVVVAPGCLDMVNFGEPASVPARYQGRRFYQHNAQVTLMRTNPEECAELGRILAAKANLSTAPVTVLLPLGGISVISAPGQPFHWPEADAALFGEWKRNLRPDIRVIEHPGNINEPAFAELCVRELLANLAVRKDGRG